MITGNFIILDAARMSEAMEEAKKMNPSHQSLYAAKEDDMLQAVAPYLFSYDGHGRLNKYFIEKGWGDSWGVLIFSKAGFDDIYRHFRRFLKVKTEDGIELYFRFYDPRVLRIFLPTCDSKQLQDFFGPVQSFVVEDEDFRYGIKFWLQNGILQSKKIHFREISGSGSADETTPDLPKSPEIKEVKEEQKEDTELYIPKQHQKESDSQSESTVPKPKKPKWNMLD